MGTIANQLIELKNALTAWAVTEKGTVYIAPDLNKMYHTGLTDSQTPRCVIAYVGEDIRGDLGSAQEARVDRQFEVMVNAGIGYTVNRGDNLVQPTDETRRPFYDLVEEARDTIRFYRMNDTDSEWPIDYRSTRPVFVNDYPINAYIISFSIGTQLIRPEIA